MTKGELRDKIRTLVKSVYKDRSGFNMPTEEYDEIAKFPQLKQALIDLLTPQFDFFVDTIDYVAPKPTTFRINLKNGENFMMIYDPRSFIVKIEGKRYYILNLNELELACIALSRLLSYGAPKTQEEIDAEEVASAEKSTSSSTSSSGGGGGGEGGFEPPEEPEETPAEAPAEEAPAEEVPAEA